MPNNYTANPETLLRKNRSRTASSSTALPTVKLVIATPSATSVMAKTLRDYSVPTVANVPVGPTVNIGDGNFELHTSLIMMV